MTAKRTYTVDGKVYEGFNREVHPASAVQEVAIVQIEDSVEVFVLDNRQYLMSLLAYLSDTWPMAHVLGVFARVTV